MADFPMEPPLAKLLIASFLQLWLCCPSNLSSIAQRRNKVKATLAKRSSVNQRYIMAGKAPTFLNLGATRASSRQEAYGAHKIFASGSWVSWTGAYTSTIFYQQERIATVWKAICSGFFRNAAKDPQEGKAPQRPFTVEDKSYWGSYRRIREYFINGIETYMAGC
ncbi:hypothetical protein BD769DRAFT_1637215 [Suillus cothurnatus]|nr:hypothetical protein BD769DRAFT_1637215 [Suillus cothurnatus]